MNNVKSNISKVGFWMLHHCALLSALCTSMSTLFTLVSYLIAIQIAIAHDICVSQENQMLPEKVNANPVEGTDGEISDVFDDQKDIRTRDDVCTPERDRGGKSCPTSPLWSFSDQYASNSSPFMVNYSTTVKHRANVPILDGISKQLATSNRNELTFYNCKYPSTTMKSMISVATEMPTPSALVSECCSDLFEQVKVVCVPEMVCVGGGHSRTHGTIGAIQPSPVSADGQLYSPLLVPALTSTVTINSIANITATGDEKWSVRHDAADARVSLGMSLDCEFDDVSSHSQSKCTLQNQHPVQGDEEIHQIEAQDGRGGERDGSTKDDSENIFADIVEEFETFLQTLSPQSEAQARCMFALHAMAPSNLMTAAVAHRLPTTPIVVADERQCLGLPAGEECPVTSSLEHALSVSARKSKNKANNDFEIESPIAEVLALRVPNTYVLTTTGKKVQKQVWRFGTSDVATTRRDSDDDSDHEVDDGGREKGHTVWKLTPLSSLDVPPDADADGDGTSTSTSTITVDPIVDGTACFRSAVMNRASRVHITTTGKKVQRQVWKQRLHSVGDSDDDEYENDDRNEALTPELVPMVPHKSSPSSSTLRENVELECCAFESRGGPDIVPVNRKIRFFLPEGSDVNNTPDSSGDIDVDARAHSIDCVGNDFLESSLSLSPSALPPSSQEHPRAVEEDVFADIVHEFDHLMATLSPALEHKARALVALNAMWGSGKKDHHTARGPDQHYVDEFEDAELMEELKCGKLFDDDDDDNEAHNDVVLLESCSLALKERGRGNSTRNDEREDGTDVEYMYGDESKLPRSARKIMRLLASPARRCSDRSDLPAFISSLSSSSASTTPRTITMREVRKLLWQNFIHSLPRDSDDDEDEYDDHNDDGGDDGCFLSSPLSRHTTEHTHGDGLCLKKSDEPAWIHDPWSCFGDDEVSPNKENLKALLQNGVRPPRGPTTNSDVKTKTPLPSSMKKKASTPGSTRAPLTNLTIRTPTTSYPGTPLLSHTRQNACTPRSARSATKGVVAQSSPRRFAMSPAVHLYYSSVLDDICKGRVKLNGKDIDGQQARGMHGEEKDAKCDSSSSTNKKKRKASFSSACSSSRSGSGSGSGSAATPFDAISDDVLRYYCFVIEEMTQSRIKRLRTKQSSASPSHHSVTIPFAAIVTNPHNHKPAPVSSPDPLN